MRSNNGMLGASAEERSMRVALLSREKELLAERNSSSFSFPSVALPLRGRGAAFITKSIEITYGTRAVILGYPLQDLCLLEVLGPTLASNTWVDGGKGDTGFVFPPSPLEPKTELPGRDGRDLRRCFDFVVSGSGPFARLGWFAELINWGNSLGFALTGGFSQFRGGDRNQLIQLETGNSPIWFKASAGSLQREFYLTPVLAKENPDIVPKVFGARPDWCGWLQCHADGVSLGHMRTLEAWKEVARRLAILQLRYLGQGNRLLSLGAKDKRITTLEPRINPFFEGMVKSMESQPSNRRDPRITREDLQRMAVQAVWIMNEAADWDLQYSLTHGDFSPDNIIVTKDGSRFLDWAEVSVGLPFETMHYLLAHRRLRYPEHDLWDRELWRAYAAEWRGLVSNKILERAWCFGASLTQLIVLLGSDFENIFADSTSQRSAYICSVTRRLFANLQEVYPKRARSRRAS